MERRIGVHHHRRITNTIINCLASPPVAMKARINSLSRVYLAFTQNSNLQNFVHAPEQIFVVYWLQCNLLFSICGFLQSLASLGKKPPCGQTHSPSVLFKSAGTRESKSTKAQLWTNVEALDRQTEPIEANGRALHPCTSPDPERYETQPWAQHWWGEQTYTPPRLYDGHLASTSTPKRTRNPQDQCETVNTRKMAFNIEASSMCSKKLQHRT